MPDPEKPEDEPGPSGHQEVTVKKRWRLVYSSRASDPQQVCSDDVTTEKLSFTDASEYPCFYRIQKFAFHEVAWKL